MLTSYTSDLPLDRWASGYSEPEWYEPPEIVQPGIVFRESDRVMPWIDEDSIQGARSIKFGGLVEALRGQPPALQALIIMLDCLVPDTYTHRVVDVRYWPELRAGDYCARPVWHTDTTSLMDSGARPETHVLWQSASYVGGETLFLGYRQRLRSGDLPEYQHALQDTIYRYGRRCLHRPSRVPADGWRLVVRVTGSDTQAPKNLRRAPYLMRPAV